MSKLNKVKLSVQLQQVGRHSPTYMAESIPLCATLRVQCISIIVGNSGEEFLDVMLELLSFKRRCLGDVQRQTGYH